MGAEDVVGVSVAGAKCEVFMLRHGSGIFCQEVLIVVPHGLREHNYRVVGVVSDDIEAEILEYSPQIAEIASACEQYGDIGGGERDSRKSTWNSHAGICASYL